MKNFVDDQYLQVDKNKGKHVSEFSDQGSKTNSKRDEHSANFLPSSFLQINAGLRNESNLDTKSHLGIDKVQESSFSSSDSEDVKEKEFEELLSFIINKDRNALGLLKFNLQRKRKGEKPSKHVPDTNSKFPDRFSQIRLLKS